MILYLLIKQWIRQDNGVQCLIWKSGMKESKKLGWERKVIARAWGRGRT